MSGNGRPAHVRDRVAARPRARRGGGPCRRSISQVRLTLSPDADPRKLGHARHRGARRRAAARRTPDAGSDFIERSSSSRPRKRAALLYLLLITRYCRCSTPGGDGRSRPRVRSAIQRAAAHKRGRRRRHAPAAQRGLRLRASPSRARGTPQPPRSSSPPRHGRLAAAGKPPASRRRPRGRLRFPPGSSSRRCAPGRSLAAQRCRRLSCRRWRRRRSRRSTTTASYARAGAARRAAQLRRSHAHRR